MNGPVVISARTVTFTNDASGLPVMVIDGFEPVRWLTGGQVRTGARETLAVIDPPTVTAITQGLADPPVDREF